MNCYPKDLLIPSVFYRIAPAGVADLVLSTQQPILQMLLADPQVSRMLDAQMRDPAHAYTAAQMVQDLQSGIWSEIQQPHPVIDLYRRNLQRAYLSVMKSKITGEEDTTSDLSPLVRSSLVRLAHQIDYVLPKTKDPVTNAHLVDCRKRIEMILSPRPAVAVAMPRMGPFMAAPSNPASEDGLGGDGVNGAVSNTDAASTNSGAAISQPWNQIHLPQGLPATDDCPAP